MNSIANTLAEAVATLREAHDALDSHLGDTDASDFETDEEEREYYPGQWAARTIFKVIELLNAAMPAQAVDLVAVLRALRLKSNNFQRYSFLLDSSGSVRKVPEKGGRWVEQITVAELLDETCTDWLESELGVAARPPAAAVPINSYRLLTKTDLIEARDEFLQDDCVTWCLDPNGVFVGMRYAPGSSLRIARRPSPCTQESRQKVSGASSIQASHLGG